jgi:hypothetical protein
MYRILSNRGIKVMGIFNGENARIRLEEEFWDNVHEIIIEEIEFSHKKCEFDECPFLALKGMLFCKEHQKEFENIEEGSQPDKDKR